MGAACGKSQRAAAAVEPPLSTAEKAEAAAVAAAEHSQKAEEAAEVAAACATKASAEAAVLTGVEPGAEPAAEAEEAPKQNEIEEQQTTTTPAQTHATEEQPAAPPVVPLSDADAQVLAAAEAAKQEAASSNMPRAYLFYACELNEGSLMMQWTTTQITEEDMHAKNLILLASFFPAKHKTVSKSKLTQNGGITYFLQEMKYKWEVWSKVQRQAYYQGWIKFVKAADEMEASFTLHHFAAPAPPAKLFLLHTGPIENKVLPAKEEEPFNVSVFGLAAVTPPSPPYKPGANITPKRFGEIATGAGGAYMQLSRRGGDAAFDEKEVQKWLAADGLQMKKGEGITLDAAGGYERRSEKKGGDAAAATAAVEAEPTKVSQD
ncbi:Immune mapped protein-1, related [Eimeria maxima]|uniref:Immune mapped protein 1 n=1 Tax=Eimeria maxima TaxID=5804 RepID=F4MKA5_EIMMA|nr:Immune mapped protein-1, related [Eimeria maxima]CBL80636.1 immune mapped protein 1 [Eimeria maxima]CBL80642.1 immune mapped protein 1 [Eimeria maxima]CDJ57702.1 Immune mapped protein-1, related [Eimeria maxima]